MRKRNFKPTFCGLETRKLLSTVTVTEGENTYTSGGHSMVDYGKLVTEVETPVVSGGVQTDEYRVMFQSKIVDLTDNTSVDFISYSDYVWNSDATTGDGLSADCRYETITTTYSSAGIAVATVSPDGSEPNPPEVPPAPVGPPLPTPVGPDPAPTDPGDPPIAPPTSPVGPALPALNHNVTWDGTDWGTIETDEVDINNYDH